MFDADAAKSAETQWEHSGGAAKMRLHEDTRFTICFDPLMIHFHTKTKRKTKHEQSPKLHEMIVSRSAERPWNQKMSWKFCQHDLLKETRPWWWRKGEWELFKVPESDRTTLREKSRTASQTLQAVTIITTISYYVKYSRLVKKITKISTQIYFYLSPLR